MDLNGHKEEARETTQNEDKSQAFEIGEGKSEDDKVFESSSLAPKTGIEGGIAKAGAIDGHEADEEYPDESDLAMLEGTSNFKGKDINICSKDLELLRKREKKKKKKKRKAILKDVADLDHFAALEVQMLSPDIADKRYSSSLESIQNDDSLIWVQLSRCRMTDKKARKLFTALKDNTTITSLDLSQNFLTDESMTSLVSVLSGGSASNLIYIDVRENQFSAKCLDTLRQLQTLRKHLKVDYNLKICEQHESNRIEDDDWVENHPSKRSTIISSQNDAFNNWDDHNPMTNIQTRFPTPEALQEKVEFALLAIKKSSTRLHVSVLANSLREIIINFSQQLSLFQGSSTDWKTAGEMPKGLSLLMENIGTFLTILDMNPPPILCQRKLEEQVVGLHRVALVELINLLLVPSSPYIEEKLVVESAPTKVVNLFFKFPWNSILQGAILRALQAMLLRPSLRFAVLEGNLGLASLLPKAGEECASLPIAKRPGFGGYITKLSKEVEMLAEKDEEVKKLLRQNEQWVIYIGPEGALKKMVTEQAGHLGGPKPFSPLIAHFFQDDRAHIDSTLGQFCGLKIS